MTWTVHTGDCLDVLRTIAPGSVDAVVTDPPYGIDFQSARRTESERLDKIANDRTPFIWWLHDAYRITKSGGALLCFCRWDVAEVFRVAIESAGWEIKSQVIWDRIGHGTGDLKASFGPRHDIIWFAIKGKFAFPWKRPASVIAYERIQGDALVHPNQKPLALMEYLCRVVCPTGGTVCDPFAGSGATGEGALIAGCNFVGIELSEKYANLARERIAAADPIGVQGNLFAPQSTGVAP